MCVADLCTRPCDPRLGLSLAKLVLCLLVTGTVGGLSQPSGVKFKVVLCAAIVRSGYGSLPSQPRTQTHTKSRASETKRGHKNGNAALGAQLRLRVRRTVRPSDDAEQQRGSPAGPHVGLWSVEVGRERSPQAAAPRAVNLGGGIFLTNKTT